MTYRRTGQGRRGLRAGVGLRPVSQYADFITDCRLPIDPSRFDPQSVGTQLLLRYESGRFDSDALSGSPMYTVRAGTLNKVRGC
jgi:hypothetical protein